MATIITSTRTMYVLFGSNGSVIVVTSRRGWLFAFAKMPKLLEAGYPWVLYATVRGGARGMLSKTIARTLAHALQYPSLVAGVSLATWRNRARELPRSHSHVFTAVHMHARSPPRDLFGVERFAFLFEVVISLDFFTDLRVKYHVM